MTVYNLLLEDRFKRCDQIRRKARWISGMVWTSPSTWDNVFQTALDPTIGPASSTARWNLSRLWARRPAKGQNLFSRTSLVLTATRLSPTPINITVFEAWYITHHWWLVRFLDHQYTQRRGQTVDRLTNSLVKMAWWIKLNNYSLSLLRPTTVIFQPDKDSAKKSQPHERLPSPKIKRTLTGQWGQKWWMACMATPLNSARVTDLPELSASHYTQWQGNDFLHKPLKPPGSVLQIIFKEDTSALMRRLD